MKQELQEAIQQSIGQISIVVVSIETENLKSLEQCLNEITQDDSEYHLERIAIYENIQHFDCFGWSEDTEENDVDWRIEIVAKFA